VKVAASGRRLTVRHNIRTPIRIRPWKSAIPEERSESENLSEKGILFATDSVIPVGTWLEILLKMPEMITGKPTTEWLCSGRVVRVIPIDSTRGKHGVGVRFDRFQVPGERRLDRIWESEVFTRR
jgi:PilZ domain